MKMKQITLNISDNKFHAFLEFIKTLDYVKIQEPDKKSLAELQSSLNQVKLMQEGKIEKQSVEDFLNEL
jgi:cystathionine beta-lyase family protein involved in aluminum resistance